MVVQNSILAKREETGRGEGWPQRDSPSQSLSNRQICKDTFPVGSTLILLVVLPVQSRRYHTSLLPTGIPSSGGHSIL